ncbi:2-oxoacid:ferredoxin oxidoreductase subunit beta [Vulgatibacter incomptus]|uniref:2-oxoglutarate oxidoreductase, beta subunit n=1 Tax=Vulgatibacter incomptus TaxID=1391653 RepID=A0A0K1P831_9BACT|nr:2-oxoacid:ferredoxin oxidoreductase subunit beta [Vulgatibacter incomptus]AKU89693.1 2-oxoglutarate oxidoreductase, beta subunit [Vulgatibacter incomptus]
MSQLTRKDFQTNQEIRWCPGCGDYAILASMQKVLPELGIAREKVVFISGIGCSSRFPYYMNTYGFHTIHGRAPAIATGLKLTRPDLQVWVVTGDGDALSIGGNHLIHVLRRNVDVKILLFNNRIYGLTKGQYSPTSEAGKKAKSTPYGSIDAPFDPIRLALGAGASFVARSIDVEAAHLQGVLHRMASHRGAALVEIFQNCNVFNDGAFVTLTEKASKARSQLHLEHGKPLVFEDGKKGIRLNGLEPEIVPVGDGGVPESELLVWDEKAQPALAFLLAGMGPAFPTPIGIFRAEERAVHHELDEALQRRVTETLGDGDLEKLLGTGDTWTVP